MNYIIKPMQTADEIDGKGYVHYKSWHETYAGLIDAEYLNNMTEEKCKAIAHKWTDNILVAKDGDKVIGFVGYGKYRDDTLTDSGEVFAIYVLADYYGQKVGYELMNAAFEKLAAYKHIAVWVLKGNERAIKFYEKYGFRFDGTEQEVKLGTPNTELRMIYEREMIETKDLIVKQGSADDWQDLYRNLWSRGEVFRYMFTKPSPTEEHAMKKTAAYAEMHKEVKTEFFVYDKATKQAIGIAGLKEMKPSVYTVTDIALCPDFHGKGYGKQILTAFLSLIFDELGATELHYDCFKQNEVSKRLALSCGFTYTHSEEAELMKDGEKVILDYYEVRK